MEKAVPVAAPPEEEDDKEGQRPESPGLRRLWRRKEGEEVGGGLAALSSLRGLHPSTNKLSFPCVVAPLSRQVNASSRLTEYPRLRVKTKH